MEASLTVASRGTGQPIGRLKHRQHERAGSLRRPGSTFSGLYQVNAVIPAGTTLGDAVPLTLTSVGLSGPPVTIAIH